MGVLLPDGLNNNLNLDTETLCQGMNQVNLNTMYRHTDVYKECSYPDFVSYKSFFTKTSRARPKQQSKKVCNLKTKKMDLDQVTWSKVYKSPTSKRNCAQKPLITESNSFTTEYKLVCTLELQKKIDDQTDTTKVVKEDELDVTPCVANIEPKRSVWRKIWPKMELPKFVCPCCTGGSDSGDRPAAGSRAPPYQMRSPVESYETVDLTRTSNTALQSLNLDASLQSILNLRGQARPKNAPRKCVNGLMNVLRNTYKNAALIITQPRS